MGNGIGGIIGGIVGKVLDPFGVAKKVEDGIQNVEKAVDGVVQGADDLFDSTLGKIPLVGGIADAAFHFTGGVVKGAVGMAAGVADLVPSALDGNLEAGLVNVVTNPIGTAQAIASGVVGAFQKDGWDALGQTSAMVGGAILTGGSSAIGTEAWADATVLGKASLLTTTAAENYASQIGRLAGGARDLGRSALELRNLDVGQLLGSARGRFTDVLQTVRDAAADPRATAGALRDRLSVARQNLDSIYQEQRAIVQQQFDNALARVNLQDRIAAIVKDPSTFGLDKLEGEPQVEKLVLINSAGNTRALFVQPGEDWTKVLAQGLRGDEKLLEAKVSVGPLTSYTATELNSASDVSSAAQKIAAARSVALNQLGAGYNAATTALGTAWANPDVRALSIPAAVTSMGIMNQQSPNSQDPGSGVVDPSQLDPAQLQALMAAQSQAPQLDPSTLQGQAAMNGGNNPALVSGATGPQATDSGPNPTGNSPLSVANLNLGQIPNP